MGHYDAAKAIQDKIEDFLDSENLVLTILDKAYPLSLIISQNRSPYAQMERQTFGDGDISATNSRLQFVFELDGLKIRTDDRLVITDAFMNKLKGLAKKWHAAFCAAFVAENLTGFYKEADGDTVEEVTLEEIDAEEVAEAAVDPFEGFMDDEDEAHDASGLTDE